MNPGYLVLGYAKMHVAKREPASVYEIPAIDTYAVVDAPGNDMEECFHGIAKFGYTNGGASIESGLNPTAR